MKPEMSEEGWWRSSKPKGHWVDWANSNSSVGSKSGIDFVPKLSDYPISDFIFDLIGGSMLVYGAAGAAGFDAEKNPWIESLRIIAEIAARYTERSPKDPRTEMMFKGYEVQKSEDMAYTMVSTPLETALEIYKDKFPNLPKDSEIKANYKKAQKVWDLIAKRKYTPKNIKKDLTIIADTMKNKSKL